MRFKAEVVPFVTKLAEKVMQNEADRIAQAHALKLGIPWNVRKKEIRLEKRRQIKTTAERIIQMLQPKGGRKCLNRK